MGKTPAQPNKQQQTLRLQFQIMCDLPNEPPSSVHHMGEEVVNTGVPYLNTFKDIDNLKSQLNGESKGIDDEIKDFKVDLKTLDQALPTDSSHQDVDGSLSLSSDDTLSFASNSNQTNSVVPNLCNVISNDNHTSDTTILKECCDKDSESAQPSEVAVSSGLSKALENISLPLLYIPKTKQLIAKTDEDFDYCDSISNGNCGGSGSQLCASAPQRDNYCKASESVLFGSENAPWDSSLSQYAMDDHSELENTTLHNAELFQEHTPYQNDLSIHLFADNSSLSSVSTGTDFSVSTLSAGEEYNGEDRNSNFPQPTEDTGFMDVNLHSRNSFDRSHNSLPLENRNESHQDEPSQSAKKKPFSSFKGIFAKRGKDESAPGWKLFGKVPPKSTSVRNAQEITSEFHARQRKPNTQKVPAVKKQQNSEVMSTTALILENRPVNLPSKNPEEEEKHRREYTEMVEAAKRKEQKDLKLKKKQLQVQRKLEDQLMSAAQIWNNDILPCWDSMKQSKKARDMWWHGLPPCIRGRVWKLAIGNDLNITNELYDICRERAEDRIRFIFHAENNQASSSSCDVTSSLQESNTSSKEDSVNVIKLDVSRTFPHLCIFQKGGPYHDLLHSLLGAYACYRPDVGYVQGMSFIAAILLLNMEVADAFVCFANLLNRPCQVAFFRMNEDIMAAYYKTFEAFFKENLPKLYAHFVSHSVTPNLYLMEWIFLLFGKSLPLDVACHVWDVYCRDGEEFLCRTAIGILKMYEIVLLKMDFFHIAQFLTKLPEDISSESLFKELDSVRMCIDKRGFQAVLSFYKDLHENSNS